MKKIILFIVQVGGTTNKNMNSKFLFGFSKLALLFLVLMMTTNTTTYAQAPPRKWTEGEWSVLGGKYIGRTESQGIKCEQTPTGWCMKHCHIHTPIHIVINNEANIIRLGADAVDYDNIQTTTESCNNCTEQSGTIYIDTINLEPCVSCDPDDICSEE